MENKLLFYKAASALPDGLSLTDYEYRFYKDNAGKEILSAEVISPVTGDTLVYDSVADEWVNKTVVPTGGSAGQVLVKDSGTDYDAVWGAPLAYPVMPFPEMISGQRYKGIGGNVSYANQTVTINLLSFTMLPVPSTTSLDLIGAYAASTYVGSGNLRVGIYSNNNGAPDSLIVDSGSLPVTGTGSNISVDAVISVTLQPGLYWIAAVSQGSPTTNSWRGTAATVNHTEGLPSSNNAVNALVGFQQTGVSGALPGTATPSVSFGPIIVPHVEVA
jgi:hypothetical protein